MKNSRSPRQAGPPTTRRPAARSAATAGARGRAARRDGRVIASWSASHSAWPSRHPRATGTGRAPAARRSARRCPGAARRGSPDGKPDTLDGAVRVSCWQVRANRSGQLSEPTRHEPRAGVRRGGLLCPTLWCSMRPSSHSASCPNGAPCCWSLAQGSRRRGRRRCLRSERQSLPIPAVIRLSRYVRVPYRSAVPLTRRAVFARDGGRCVYCDAPATSLDHVVPRSRGGRTPGTTSCRPAGAATTSRPTATSPTSAGGCAALESPTALRGGS